MALFVSDDIATLLNVFSTFLGTSQNEGTAKLDNSIVSEAVPGMDRISDDKQSDGRDGTKGFIAALMTAFAYWPMTKVTIGDTGAPAYQNSFVAQTSSGTADSAYYSRHLNSDVVIGGWVTAPASPGGKTIFNIPAAYRPAKRLWFVVPTDAAAPNNTGTVTIETNGNVVVQIMSNSVSFSLDGIRFRSA